MRSRHGQASRTRLLFLSAFGQRLRGDEVPFLLQPPSLNQDLSQNNDQQVAAAVFKLCSLLASPPERPNLKRVLTKSVQCLNRFHAAGRGLPTEVTSFLSTLNRAAVQLQQTPYEKEVFFLAGRERRFQVWHNLINMPSDGCDDLELAVGVELAMASVVAREFRPRVAAAVRDILVEHSNGDPTAAAHQAKNLAHRLVREASRVLIRSMDIQSRKSMLFCSRVTGHLIGQLDPSYLTSRQAAGSIRSLSVAETRRTAAELRTKAEAGDVICLATITAFCAGLPWDLALDTPFSCTSGEDWLARLDLQTGEIHIDLGTALPQMARALPDHTPASTVVVRPLPDFLARLLRSLVATNVDATCLRDLIPQTTTSSRHRLDTTDRALGISISRFVNSRGPFAVELGIDRAIAAFSTLDLTLIGKAKFHYLTVHRTELWQATTEIYRELEWGEPSANAIATGLAIGARVTPEEALIRQIDQSFCVRARDKSPGRRYTEESLLEGTNAYAELCALRATLFWSARGANTFPILANELISKNGFGRLQDKGTGPFPGETPLPIPLVLARQVEYWRVHLEVLDRRLCKLSWVSSHPVRMYISQVLSQKEVPLFFLIHDRKIKPLGSKALLESLPEGIKINRDAFRHFVPNRLRKLGVPSSFVDAYIRHHTEGIAFSSASCSISQIQWLSAVSSGLDQLAVELNIRPVAGLARRP